MLNRLFNKLFRRVDQSDIAESAKSLAKSRKEQAKKLFYDKQLTPKEIAEKLGVARSTVYMYLEGVRSAHTGSNPTS